MAVTEVLRALGSWELAFTSGIPRETWDALEHFGHIALHAGPVDVRVAGDSLLGSARYVGVVRSIAHDGSFAVRGPGMAFWLGDEEGKGPVIESLLTITAQTFENSVRAILPPASSAILEGTYFNLPGPPPPFTGTFQWQTQREALNYLSDVMGAEWKVLGTGRLVAGPAANLFVTTPTTVVMRRNHGVDMALRGFPGQIATERDAGDFTTRLVLLADDGSGGVASATADISGGLNPYKDLHGATLRMTRLVQETTTDFSNAPARAQLQLNRFTRPKDGLVLSTAQYDVKGDVEVGDWLWVYDPDLGIIDPANEIAFRQERLQPMKLRLTEMTWPVSQGMSVAYRNRLGVWYDLTNYLIPESGETSLVVSGFNHTLGDGSNGGGGLPAPLPQPNLTVPAAPTWVTPFTQGVYQSPLNGETKSQTELRWLQPANTDGSAITDGAYYEIRYRSATVPLFPVTHAQMAVFTHAQLAANGGTEGQPIQYPVGEWQYQRVPFSQLATVLYELTPSVPYEAQIRAVDTGTPANAGAWSVLTSWQTAQDSLPPAIPAAPEVAASLISVQILHRLGKSSGGTFNLDRDLHHLEIHGEYEPGFAPSEATRLGRLVANSAVLIAQIPVVGTFPIPDLTPVYFKVIAVDTAGNKSGPSPAAVATAQLIDDAHISSLTVSKLTAGTITAAFIHAGWLRIGAGDPGSGTGPAIELTPGSIQAINEAGGLSFDVQASTGKLRTFGDGGIEVHGAGSLKVQGSGSLKVIDSGGVERLNVARSDVTIRDANNNSVFSNVTASGWGITKPDLPIAMWPSIPWDGVRVRDFPGSSYTTLWITRIPVNHPQLAWGIYGDAVLSSAVGDFGLIWSTVLPTEFDAPGTVIYASPTMTANTVRRDFGTYNWPTDMFGDQVYIFLKARMTSGTGYVSVMPIYLYGFAN
jgi:hypothetical protein